MQALNTALQSEGDRTAAFMCVGEAMGLEGIPADEAMRTLGAHILQALQMPDGVVSVFGWRLCLWRHDQLSSHLTGCSQPPFDFPVFASNKPLCDLPVQRNAVCVCVSLAT